MKTGIVFEGGAYRTLFSCGVMDAFIEKDIYPDYVIGTSAGAAYTTSYLSKQKGRMLDVILKYGHDKRYFGINNMVDAKNRCIYNLKFSYETIPNELTPFDYDAFKAWGGEFYAVCTNVETGKAEYFPYTGDDRTNTVLKATCALPMLFPYIYIDGVPYLDGGLSDSIPFEKALADGCDRLVVVLTREQGYKKTTSSSAKIMARAYVKYPELSKDLLKRAGRYNRCIRRLEKMEKEGKLIVIRPTSTKGFSRLEHDQQKILNLYADGYNKGLEISDKVKDYFRNSQK
ncbi:MAG: patatin family protein [Clostridia bacterium]|nr:patatin family protein [Clostridia bacterium]